MAILTKIIWGQIKFISFKPLDLEESGARMPVPEIYPENSMAQLCKGITAYADLLELQEGGKLDMQALSQHEGVFSDLLWKELVELITKKLITVQKLTSFLHQAPSSGKTKEREEASPVVV